MTFSEDHKESFLIKRIYLDSIGLLPTTQEIEWFCTYNDNSYETAVNWLILKNSFKWTMPEEYIKLFLNSKEYKSYKKLPLSKEQIYKNLFYVCGMDKDLIPNETNIKTACIKLIECAKKCAYSDDDIIDYMAMSLMCRNTNVEENNKLRIVFNESIKNSNELNAWIDVLKTILEFEDVKTK
jgi:hypothetical protein